MPVARRRSDPLLSRAAWTAYAVAQLPLQRRLPFRSAQSLARRQAQRVRAAVAFAYAHVPYYRETMDRLGLTPEAFRGAADLALLPIVEREQLQRDPERFLSRALPRERYVQLATDGSTGSPVIVQHDPFALFQGVGHYERAAAIAWRLAGRPLVLRRVLVGYPTGVVARTSASVRERSVVSPALRYRDLRLTMADPLSDNAERLLAFAPHEVRGYGSYLEELFTHVHRLGTTSGLPRALVYVGDSMSEAARKMIGQELGISVLSEYGAGEAHHMGFECEIHSGLHLNEDLYPARVVDADGNELPPGHVGEIAVSNLVNRGTVLLNYRIGDVVRRLDHSCPCGRTLPLISFPLGRTDEWCTSASGELIHGQEIRGLLLADDAFLIDFQVVQESPQEFSIAVTTRDGCDQEGFRAGVEQRFAERFGRGTRTRVSFVESLERTRGGKVRTVISRVGVPSPPRAVV